MDKEEIELLISARVSEAKAEVWEKRFKWSWSIMTIILAFVGGVVPYLLSRTSADDVKVAARDARAEIAAYRIEIDQKKSDLDGRLNLQIDKLSTSQTSAVADMRKSVSAAISDMKSEFNEAIGKQLRKPDLKLYYQDKNAEITELPISPADPKIGFLLKNIGDAKAENVTVRLYVDTIFQDGPIYTSLNNVWTKFDTPPSDEPGLRYYYDRNLAIPKIDAKDYFVETIGLNEMFPGLKGKEIKAMLKIGYGEANPKRFEFRLKFLDK